VTPHFQKGRINNEYLIEREIVSSYLYRIKMLKEKTLNLMLVMLDFGKQLMNPSIRIKLKKCKDRWEIQNQLTLIFAVLRLSCRSIATAEWLMFILSTDDVVRFTIR